MKKSLITLAAIAALMAGSAMAQSKGEADPKEGQPAAKQVTAQEKKAARQARTVDGKAAVKTSTGEQPAPGGVAKSATAEEKKAARAKRKAAAADAVKKGQTTSGEK